MSIADNAQALALLIDGQDAPTSATRTVRDPATGEPLAEVADAAAAIGAASPRASGPP
jgi:acyl-CoA reductase-like NAD-dependent aldehyde dehydrogenase